MEQISTESFTKKTKSLFRFLNPRFQGLIRIFVLSFENGNDRTVNTKYYLPTVEINDYNIMINGKNSFDQPVKSSVRTYAVCNF